MLVLLVLVLVLVLLVAACCSVAMCWVGGRAFVAEVNVTC